ncbi:MAG TPA: DNA-3-methyladenine glycosylase I [Candidatus Acidoferrum sp.]|nr:DNA-3-methyladenine glycosylase I [Candidatus Acidoferrum sp.]
MKKKGDQSRCPWPTDELYIRYHDCEWAVPLHDDRRLFELLILEGAQAGLSWHTVLKKRENYRVAFDGFDPEKVARYDAATVARLMNNPGLIRNRLKIQSAIQNARAFLRVQEEFGSFDAFIWRFVNGNPVVNHWKTMKEVPARTEISDALSRDLGRRGFNFVGSTICYAHMQATGMVNDHLVACFRHRQLGGGKSTPPPPGGLTSGRRGRGRMNGPVRFQGQSGGQIVADDG